MNLSKEDREYVPTSFDLQCMAEAEWLENLHKPKPYQKKKNPPKKKAKPKMKQPTLKQVVKKMNQNFQGFSFAKCQQVPGHGELVVYIPSGYGNKTKKRHNGALSARDREFCKHCYLQPCSMIEYKDALTSVLEEKNNWLYLTEDELLIKVRMRYRAEAMKTYNKTWVTKSMPTNNDLPQCALVGTRDLVKDTGYDSLLEQSPFSRDKMLNKRDNDREAASRMEAELELGLNATPCPQKSTSYANSEEDSSECEFDSEDDLPLASLVKSKTGSGTTRLKVVDEYESEEENEFD